MRRFLHPIDLFAPPPPKGAGERPNKEILLSVGY